MIYDQSATGDSDSEGDDEREGEGDTGEIRNELLLLSQIVQHLGMKNDVNMTIDRILDWLKKYLEDELPEDDRGLLGCLVVYDKLPAHFTFWTALSTYVYVVEETTAITPTTGVAPKFWAEQIPIWVPYLWSRLQTCTDKDTLFYTGATLAQIFAHIRSVQRYSTSKSRPSLKHDIQQMQLPSMNLLHWYNIFQLRQSTLSVKNPRLTNNPFGAFLTKSQAPQPPQPHLAVFSWLCYEFQASFLVMFALTAN